MTPYIIKRCDCGCGVLTLDKYSWPNGETEYGLSYHKAAFGVMQTPWWKRIKWAWYTLRGKDYWLFDIILSEADFQDLRKWMEGVDKE